MTGATPTSRFSALRGRRVATLAAIALAIIGALLITLAACSSRPGPPQPTPAAAGVIDSDPTPVSSAAVNPSTGAEKSTAPTSAPAARSTPKTTSAGSPPSSKSAAHPDDPVPPLTNSGIAPPSFANSAQGLILASSVPVSLSIPSLGVKSALLDLGLNADGSVQVPSLTDPNSKAGWYKYSPTPGAIGPAIILGHIDSKQFGPGVFYDLGKLMPGQEIDVTRQDGTVAVFKVDGVRSYSKTAFPTKDVYGNINHAGLRLITCGGTFNPAVGHYESNIVAYASLVSSHPA